MSGNLTEALEAARPVSRQSATDPSKELPASQLSRKRSREDFEHDAPVLKDITIRPYAGSLYDKPTRLRPIRLLPRSKLPLSFLDTSSNPSISSLVGLFTSKIEALENEASQADGPSIVIATLAHEKRPLYAIERVKQGIYSASRLCAWVKIQYIEDGASAVLEHGPQKPAPKRRKVSIALPTPPTSTPPSATEVPPTLNNTPEGPPPVVVMNKSPEQLMDERMMAPQVVPEDSAPDLVAEEPKSDDEVFEALIKHYLEALYYSKTSWAFFIKGPLSRARNAFLSTLEGRSLPTLTAQLRAMLLTMTATNKKFNEKLPEMIRDFPKYALTDDEDPSPPKRKRKSKKLPKVSSGGVYPMEEEHCKRWWMKDRSENAKPRPDETFEQLIKRRIGDLRRRETLAQISLILEILALEASPEYKTATEKAEAAGSAESQGVDTQVTETQLESQAAVEEEAVIQSKPKRKVKKPADLGLLLDLLLDKLTIWQSIESDGEAVDYDAKRDHALQNNEKLHEQDGLVAFCTDVVITFYKSRLPEQASLVNKKLGGPGAISPKPDKQKGSEKEKQKERPGDKRPRKPLQKTLSDTFIRSRQPSLARSNSDINGIARFKRELSEISMRDIPEARPSHRDSASQLRHLQSRQVDMTALSAATDTKLKRKKKIEEDLKQARDPLTRPTRGHAVKDLAEAADARSLGSASMRKKTMAPVRKVLQTVRNVQVTATPRHKRGFNALSEEKGPRKIGSYEPPTLNEGNPPSSGDFSRVPESSLRSSAVDMIGATPAVSRTAARGLPMEQMVAQTPSRRATLPSIAETPSRSAATGRGGLLNFEAFLKGRTNTGETAPETPLKRPAPLLDIDAVPQSSPAGLAVSATPMKVAATPRRSDDGVFATPLKRTAAGIQSPLKTVGPASAPEEDDFDLPGGKSIYEAMGWD